jgi:uncharacterized protein YlxW (UPF0749 family)
MSKRTETQDSTLLLQRIWNDVQDNSYHEKMENRKKRGKTNSDPKWWIVVVLTIGGLIFGIGASITRESIPLSLQNRDLLREGITGQSLLLEQKESTLEEITQQISSLQETQAALLPNVDQDELALLNAVTGYQAISGPGVVVELTDADLSKLGLDVDPSLAKVFATDLVTIVNGLWTAGAEAIAIGNQRVAPRSAISQSGEAILVNYRPILPPYQIYAVGPDSLLSDFLKTSDFKEVNEVSRVYGIGLNVNKIDSIDIPTAVRPMPDISGLKIGSEK